MDVSPAVISHTQLEWTDGNSFNWQLPILQKMKPSMHSQVVLKKVACAQKPLTGWMTWLVQDNKTEEDHLNIEKLTALIVL